MTFSVATSVAMKKVLRVQVQIVVLILYNYWSSEWEYTQPNPQYEKRSTNPMRRLFQRHQSTKHSFFQDTGVLFSSPQIYTVVNISDWFSWRLQTVRLGEPGATGRPHWPSTTDNLGRTSSAKTGLATDLFRVLPSSLVWVTGNRPSSPTTPSWID